MRNLKNHIPLQNDGGPLSGLQHKALASLVHFATYTTKWTRGASALHWGQRGASIVCTGVGFLKFLISALFLHFFQLHPYLKGVLSEIFPLSFSSFLGEFLNQLPNRKQTHSSLATRQSLLLTSKYESHCRRTCLLLVMNVFWAEDKHFWRCRWASFTLEMNIIALETACWKCEFKRKPHTYTHTRTASYQRLPNWI